MGATQTQLSDKQLLARAYRDAFDAFKREAGRFAGPYNPVTAENAMLRVEQARLAYNETRDLLAASLLAPEQCRAFWAIPGNSRVKDVAELFWLMAGKPQGSADEDWFRAERVVRHASDLACYASH